MLAGFLYYIIVYPFSLMPLAILYRFSDLFYIILISIFPYRKKIIDLNLKNAFPNKSASELKVLRRKFYRHFSDLLIEGIKNLSISKNELEKRFKFRNPEIIDQLYRKNKSVILVSGHYNNWEWLITSLSLQIKHKAIGIGMPMTNKFWDKKVNEKRERFGLKVVHAKNYKKHLDNNKKASYAIINLSDQSPGNSHKSYWMTFLNQPTAVLYGTEKMAHEFNYAVVFFKIEKVKRGFYELSFDLICEEPRNTEWGFITEQHTNKLENLIIQNPEFWIWSHKRWKREIPENLESLKIIQKEKFLKQYFDKN
jgi:KDO2-lipid IV(A) lauroyltransferase